VGKFVYLLAMFSLLLLVICSYIFPTSIVMYLASTSPLINTLRVALILFLMALLVTNPSRHLFVRCIISFAAVGILSWAITQTYETNMQILDCLSLSAASISMVIGALELRFDVSEVDIELLRQAKSRPYLNGYNLSDSTRISTTNLLKTSEG
jgi:hypothetical protein